MRKPFVLVIIFIWFMVSCDSQKKLAQEQDPAALYARSWKLIELDGTPIGATNKEPHMILQPAENRVSGNGGCNSFFGTFEHPAFSRIKFSAIGSTKMACPNMEVETRFFQALEQANNYTIKEDTLSLRKDQVVSAKFVAQLSVKNYKKTRRD
jgi:heat shock protein HslJ